MIFWIRLRLPDALTNVMLIGRRRVAGSGIGLRGGIGHGSTRVSTEIGAPLHHDRSQWKTEYIAIYRYSDTQIARPYSHLRDH